MLLSLKDRRLLRLLRHPALGAQLGRRPLHRGQLVLARLQAEDYSVMNSYSSASLVREFMTDTRSGFRGHGCDPSQLTEGEPGCIFLLEQVTNPAESTLGPIKPECPTSSSCLRKRSHESRVSQSTGRLTGIKSRLPVVSHTRALREFKSIRIVFQY